MYYIHAYIDLSKTKPTENKASTYTVALAMFNLLPSNYKNKNKIYIFSNLFKSSFFEKLCIQPQF
jgi:hypothetical protein